MKNIVIGLMLVSALLSYNVKADEIEETRQVETFSLIDLRIAGNVYIKQGNDQKVVVKGNQKDIEDLITEVKNGNLIIRYENWFGTHSKVEVFIEVKEIDGMDVSGSGSILAEGAIKTDEIEFEVSGSGSITIPELTARIIENDISGSGKINLSGTGNVEKMDCEISGSGKVYAFGITAENVSCEISGSGKIETTAASYLEADISGSGKVYYKGNARINADISGSGKVIHEE